MDGWRKGELFVVSWCAAREEESCDGTWGWRRNVATAK